MALLQPLQRGNTLDLTDHLLMNGVVFAGFFGIAFVHHTIKYKRTPTAREHLAHALMSGVFSPAALDAIRDFAVHFVVYSGYLIPQH